MGNCPYELSTYQLSGKRYTPSFLQGHPSSLRFGHPDVTAGDTAFLRGRHAMPFLRSYRGPALAELGHPDVASGRDSYARGSLNCREAYPVLSRQLFIRLHKPACTRTRCAENAHTLITHRLKQTQQLRGHVGCRK